MAELLAYGEQPCRWDAGKPLPAFPLPDDAQVQAWLGYEREAAESGAIAALTRHLVQLRFPVRRGMSEEERYRQATRRGIIPAAQADAPGLALRHPERVRVERPSDHRREVAGPRRRRSRGLRNAGAGAHLAQRARPDSAGDGRVSRQGPQQLESRRGVPRRVAGAARRRGRRGVVRGVSAPRAAQRAVSGPPRDPEHGAVQRRPGRRRRAARVGLARSSVRSARNTN